VPMILSDLDVHREQAAHSASYFEMDDPAALANHIMRVSQQSDPPSIRDFVPGHDDRVAAFAADFARVIQNALRPRRNICNKVG